VDEARPERLVDLDISLKEAAAHLGIDEARVKLLESQGRLELILKDGERRIEIDSVFRMEAEELIRGMTAKAQESCPELVDEIDHLAMVQYSRGYLASFNALGKNLMEVLKETREQSAELEAALLTMKEQREAERAELKRLTELLESHLDERRSPRSA
jgi:hypothetical protein